MKSELLTLMGFALVAGLAAQTPAKDFHETKGVVAPGDVYGTLHVQWWQWADGIANEDSPVYQRGGAVHTSNQPDGPVWFLAGYFGDWFNPQDPVVFTRQITVPQGKQLFFPVLNGELTPMEWKWDYMLAADETWTNDWAAAHPDGCVADAIVDFEAQFGVTVPDPAVTDLWTLLESWFADPSLVDAMEVRIDNKKVQDLEFYRAAAPEAYTTEFPASNHMEFYYPGGGVATPVVADGWCILLEPMPVGEHTVHFKANFGGTLGMDITYVVTVVPK